MMMRKHKLILLFCLSVSLLWSEVYENKEIGFEFKVPDECILHAGYSGYAFEGAPLRSDKYYVDVLISKNTNDNQTKENIANNIPSDMIPPLRFSTHIKFVMIGGIKGEIHYFADQDSEGVIGKRLIFFKGKDKVEIALEYDYDFDPSKPDFLLRRVGRLQRYYLKNIYGTTDQSKLSVGEYYEQQRTLMQAIEVDMHKIIKGEKVDIGVEVPSEMIEMYKKFDELVNSIEFYPATSTTGLDWDMGK